MSDEETRLKAMMLGDNIKLLIKYRDQQFDTADDFAVTRTIGLSDSFITVNVGLLSAMAFILALDNSLTQLSQYLVIVLILPLINIHHELKFKDEVTKGNIKISRGRAIIADKRTVALSELFDVDHSSLGEVTEVMKKMKEEDDASMQGLNDELAEKEKEFSSLRTWSTRFLFIAIIGIMLIILSESGTLENIWGLVNGVCRCTS